MLIKIGLLSARWGPVVVVHSMVGTSAVGLVLYWRTLDTFHSKRISVDPPQG